MPASATLRVAALDTNMMLLWLVVQTDLALLNNYKRVRNFDRTDVVLLRNLLEFCERFITTPHILGETDNFIDQAPAYRRIDLRLNLRRLIDSAIEVYEPAKTLVRTEAYATLGLSDSSLAAISTEATIITLDFSLAGFIRGHGGSVVNFQQYRAVVASQ